MPLSERIPGELRDLLSAENVLTEPGDLIPYSFDSTAALRQIPGCVIFTRTTDYVVTVLKLANETKTLSGSRRQKDPGERPGPIEVAVVI